MLFGHLGYEVVVVLSRLKFSISYNGSRYQQLCMFILEDQCFSKLSSMLSGECWDLKSTHLKPAKFEKHGSR